MKKTECIIYNNNEYEELDFSEEYEQEEIEPQPPEWKVTYEDGFWSQRGRGGKCVPIESSICQEISIEKNCIQKEVVNTVCGSPFNWGEETWHIPAVYLCTKGVIVDFAVEVNPASVRTFFEKWNLHMTSYSEHTEAEQEQMQQEHPLNIGFQAEICMNGQKMQREYAYAMSWLPFSCLSEKTEADSQKILSQEQETDNIVDSSEIILSDLQENIEANIETSLEAKWFLEHYGYDLNRAWVIQRVGFPWGEKRLRKVKSLHLKLERDKVNIYGESFFAPNVGNSIILKHLNQKQEYILTVQEYLAQKLEQQHFGRRNAEANIHEQEVMERLECSIDEEPIEYPTNFHAMTYTIYPELQDFYICDCKQGDTPRLKKESPHGPISVGAVAVLGMPRKEDREKYIHVDGTIAKTYVACSSLYFEETDKVEWKIVFREKQMSDLEVILV